MTSMRKLKRFCTVIFPKEKDSVAVVPKTWLQQQPERNYLCKWPSTGDKETLIKLKKEESEPVSEWQSYPAKVIRTSKRYENTEAAMKEFQSLNEVDIFSPNTDVESESITPNSQKPSPSTAVGNTNCYNLEKRLINMEQEILSSKEMLMDLKTTTSNLFMSVNTLLRQSIPQRFEEFQQLDTVEDLLVFNEKLADNEFFSKMTIYFSAFGGKDAHYATRKIMSVLMTNRLALNYNWIGGRMKQSIQEYRLVIQLVTASVRHNKMFAEASVSKIESWIARWLRYAGDRQLGTRKRKHVVED